MAEKNYHELEIWQKAMALTVEIHKLTKPLLESELDFTNNLRRSATLVTARISEGYGILELSFEDFFDCLSSSKGHLAEVETQLLLGVKIGFFSEEDAATALNLCQEIDEKLFAMMKN